MKLNKFAIARMSRFTVGVLLSGRKSPPPIQVKSPQTLPALFNGPFEHAERFQSTVLRSSEGTVAIHLAFKQRLINIIKYQEHAFLIDLQSQLWI